MSTRRTETVRTGRRYRLTVAPVVKPKPKPKPDAFGQRVVPRPQLAIARPEFRFYFAGTRLNTEQRSDAGDSQNVFVAQSLEGSVIESDINRRQITRAIIDSCATSDAVSYLYSGRSAYSYCWPFQATSETDGYNLSLTMRSTAAENETRTFGIQTSTDWVRKMQPVADQLSAFDAVAGSIVWTDGERTAARANIAALELEKFNGYTAARVQRDMVVAPAVPSGAWDFGIENAYHVQPFKLWDTVNYKITTEDYYESPTETTLRAAVGEMQRSDIRVFLVPQRHKYTYRYWALYTLATLFLPPLLVPIVQTGTFLARVPFHPQTFKFSSTAFTGANDVAVSETIGASAQLSLSLAGDLATQYFSPYSAFVLEGRVEGTWSLRAVSLRVGELAAIIDVVSNGETRRYYVWRRTAMTRAQLIDYGPLMLSPIITPMNAAGGTYNFSQGPLVAV